MNRFVQRRRRGFSLIELLIVVAIIAALVGVAVPFFQDNLSEAQRTKAKQDLEVIKKAISLFDAREPRALTGTDLKPLLGRYMQELPTDPWGNDYLFDGSIGMVCSFGADALPLGSGGDTDIVVYTKPPVIITRVQYQGAWGRPRAIQSNRFSTGNKFVISLSKPATEVNDANTSNSFVLLRNLQAQAAANNYAKDNPAAGGDAILLGNDTVWVNGTFESTATSGAVDPLHKPALGVFVITAYENNIGDSSRQAVTPTMAVDFDCIQDTGEIFGYAPTGGTEQIAETHYAGVDPTSPMDSTVYGPEAYDEYKRPPQCVELVNGERRGVRIEKY